MKASQLVALAGIWGVVALIINILWWGGIAVGVYYILKYFGIV